MSDQLFGAGYRNVVGTDFSQKMLVRCRLGYSESRLVQNDGHILPFRDGSFDAVLLFTVLTCIPGDDDQRQLLAEVERLLRPAGILYISDLLINSDLRNVERYEHDADRFGLYGIFELPEGVIVRHHRQEWIEQLTGSFDRLALEQFTVTTMNGNESAAFQYLGRVPR